MKALYDDTWVPEELMQLRMQLANLQRARDDKLLRMKYEHEIGELREAIRDLGGEPIA